MSLPHSFPVSHAKGDVYRTNFSTNPSPATNWRTRHATNLRTTNFAKSAVTVAAVAAAAAVCIAAAEGAELVPMDLRQQSCCIRLAPNEFLYVLQFSLCGCFLETV